MNIWHLPFSGKAITRLLPLLCASMVLGACYRLPFLPHREIDSFQPVASELTETMEVRGVTYVRVIKPDNGKTEGEEPTTVWIPLDIFRKGSYQPYQSPMVKKPQSQGSTVADQTEQQPAATSGNLPEVASPAGNMLPATRALAEEELVDTGKKPVSLPLRRRGIFFPSRATIRYPQIASQLIIELERQLPLAFLPLAYIPPRDDSWQTNDTDTLIHQSKNWLKKIKNLPPAQLIFLLTEVSSSYRPRFQVSILDAQTANPVASFTISVNTAGGRLMPPRPQPLVQLVLTSPWWCAVTPGPDRKTVFLAAGQKSRVTTGLQLQLCRPATKIFDPKDGSLLGFAMGKPLAEAVVTDFFGQDGAIAGLRSPVDIPPAGCLAVPYPE
jgi:hypothetical protein